MKSIFKPKFILIFLLSAVLLSGLFVYDYSKYNDGKLHVIFCDVGQGDGIFIRTPKGTDILVDGGPNNSIISCLSNHMPFWDKRLEAVILTHPHEDHMFGILEVAKRYDILALYTENAESKSLSYKELTRILKNKNIAKKTLYKADKLKISDGVILTTLWPDKQSSINSQGDLDKNGLSLVELLEYQNFKLLLTGDAGTEVMGRIKPYLSEINVLKVPHHGSRTGLDKPFLDKIKPKLAVISVGAKNRYGHPAPNILNMLKINNIKTLRTDRNGEVEVITNGARWEIRNY